MKSNLDEMSAYQAMIVFLEYYYQNTKDDGIGALLGSMQLIDEGKPADQGMWDDWMKAVTAVSAQERMAS